MDLVDLTMQQAEGNYTHPVHGRTPLFLPGTGSHGSTRRWGIENPYDGSRISVANEYMVITGHTGTHVDAPYHADATSQISVDQVPLQRTTGSAIWLDVSRSVSPRAVIEPSDLETALQSNGLVLEPDDIVLIHTGWSAAPTKQQYITESPTLSAASAEWLRERHIKALGIDLSSPDGHDARDLPVHMNFLRPVSLGLDESDYILIYENLVHIDAIPVGRFTFVGAPIPFQSATGSPVRAYAVIPADAKGG